MPVRSTLDEPTTVGGHRDGSAVVEPLGTNASSATKAANTTLASNTTLETNRSTGALFFALSVIFGIVYFLMAPFAGIGPGPESLNLARSLAANGNFADPYHALATGFSAHTAPLYPFFLAALLRLFGNTGVFAIVVVAWNIAAQALMVSLLPALSQSLFKNARPGIIASILFVALPLNLMWAQWEAITVCCGLALFCVGTRRIKTAPIRADVLAGCAIGGLILLSPAILIPCVSWLAFCIRGAPRRRVVRLAAASAAAVLFVCLPWTARNYVRLHALIPIRDNFGLELYVSNRDGAGPTYMENFTRNPNMPHPNSNVEEARMVRELGEAAYNRDRQARSLQWIVNHKGEFLSLTWLRIQRYWFPLREPMPLSSRSVWAVTVLSVIGLGALAVRKSAALWFIAPALAVYPLPYYLTNNDARYRYPVLWLSVLCAGYALAMIIERFRWNVAGKHPSA